MKPVRQHLIHAGLCTIAAQSPNTPSVLPTPACGSDWFQGGAAIVQQRGRHIQRLTCYHGLQPAANYSNTLCVAIIRPSTEPSAQRPPYVAVPLVPLDDPLLLGAHRKMRVQRRSRRLLCPRPLT